MPNTTKPDEFDRAIEATAEQLDEIARQTLEDEQVKKALEDPGHDDQW